MTHRSLIATFVAVLSFGIASCMSSGPAPGPGPSPGPGPGSGTVEYNVDRPGANYHNFDLSASNPTLCQSACLADPNCRSWTYVNPGVQGPAARCWLKSGVPASQPNTCCVSGVR